VSDRSEPHTLGDIPPRTSLSRARPRTFIWLAVLVMVFAAASGLGWWWQARPLDAPPLARHWRASVSTLAGDGVAGFRDGLAERARFSEPFGVAVGPDGTIYVADAGEAHRVRRLTPDGQVSTLAGGDRGFADGPGQTARFSTPSGLALAPDGTLFVADTGNNAIRRVAPDGSVTTIAGGGIAGDADGMGREARFNGPIGVAVDRKGRVLVADS
jgi:glucose/arabinose dehydrogenase